MLKRFSFSFLIIAVAALVLSGCSGTEREVGELDDFATCVKESGLEMYGSMTCSVCKRQRELFGSSFDLVGEIECHPRGENPQTQLCFEKGIEKTPTWILGEQRLEGFQTLETLAEMSGCSLPVVG